ncbi:hypothetical protein ACLB2K_009210 [Fragaria x ananassa]
MCKLAGECLRYSWGCWAGFGRVGLGWVGPRKGCTPNPNFVVVHVVASSSNDYISHNPTTRGHKTNSNGSAIPASSFIKWLPPLCNLVKLNFDGSVCHNKKADAGFVIRDHEGNPILAGSRCVGNSNVLIAEYCSTLRDGLFHALCNDIRRVQVEGDSKLIIDLINNRSPPSLWRLCTLFSDVGWMASKFEEITFKYVSGEANFVTNAMASLGHQSQIQLSGIASSRSPHLMPLILIVLV